MIKLLPSRLNRAEPELAPLNRKTSLPMSDERLSVITSSPCPAANIKVSSPSLPLRRSLPEPPSRISTPAPPLSVSSPAPPFRTSFPEPPLSESLPKPPYMRSTPYQPDSLSLFAVPHVVTPTAGLLPSESYRQRQSCTDGKTARTFAII